MQLLAGAYQRRQLWLSEIQAHAVARSLGIHPASGAAPPAARQEAPSYTRESHMRATSGKVYEKIDPFEMMRIVNGA